MRHFRENIRTLEAYTPGEQPQHAGFIKLNTNESPYPPCPEVIEAMRAAVNDSLRLYPDPLCSRVRERAAQVLGVEPGMVIAGNGSDDILTIVLRSFVGEGEKVVLLNPSYGLYGVLAKIQNARECAVEYTDDFRLPDEIYQADAKLTFICSPNNPTGTMTPGDEVAALAQRTGGVVVVDEAYVDFADSSCLELVRRFDNVIVLRSLSKSYSLAGLRVGLGVACPDVIDGMMKVKDSYNLDRLAIAGAEAALASVEKMRENVEHIKRDRRYLIQELEKLNFDVLPSEANFVFARPPKDAGGLYRKLKERRILVRYWDRPRLADGVRISIGTRQELDALLKAAREIMDQT
jgi:histidinol-phosphate aminotransferase